MVRIAVVAVGLFLGVIAVAPGSALADNQSYCELMNATGHFGQCSSMASYGHGVCAQFDRGNDWYSILTQLDSTVGEEHSAAVLVTAVSELCPWHEGKTP